MTQTSINTSAATLFTECCKAIEEGKLITRESRQDKEFHFQNWVESRIKSAGLKYDPAGRNSYPDFTLIHSPEGFEVKGLGWPGRETSYDSNSRVPSGKHGEREVYYVFGRYPSDSIENEYPVIDLVICHGDFLNANHEYIHKNKSFRGFGSYGDVLVRDRKMYVAPTPFALIEGATGAKTLILPSEIDPSNPELIEVGQLTRVETNKIIISYEFNLVDNTLVLKTAPNPTAGLEHKFTAYRYKNAGSGRVAMKNTNNIILDEE